MVDFEVLLAQHVLGNTSGRRLSELACELMEADVDSYSLRLLAGERDPTMSDAEPLLRNAAGELGFKFPPSVERAAILVARYYAKCLLDGALTAMQAAERLWREVFHPYLQREGPSDSTVHPSISDIMQYSDDLLSAKTDEQKRTLESGLFASAEKLVSEQSV